MALAESIRQFRDRALRPALRETHMWSPTAEALLLGTAAQESKFRYLEQLGNGPALGLFQMEPATHDDIWNNWLRYKPVWNARARYWSHHSNVPGMERPQASEMTWNLRYAAVMARLHYMRVSEPLPDKLTPTALGQYWKKYYNTHLGKGTVQEFTASWHNAGISALVKPYGVAV